MGGRVEVGVGALCNKMSGWNADSCLHSGGKQFTNTSHKACMFLLLHWQVTIKTCRGWLNHSEVTLTMTSMSTFQKKRFLSSIFYVFARMSYAADWALDFTEAVFFSSSSILFSFCFRLGCISALQLSATTCTIVQEQEFSVNACRIRF